MSQQSSLEERDAEERRPGTPEVARRPDRCLVLVASVGLAGLTALPLFGPGALRFAVGALLAACAAYLLLGPAMTVTVKLLRGWMSPGS